MSTTNNDYSEVISTLEKQFLSFTLGEEQIIALNQVLDFINLPDWGDFVLSGSAGVGKSSIAKLIIHYLEYRNIPYLIATPTNKACGVITEVTGRDSITLHRLLELKPTLNILHLDYKDLHWDSNTFSSGIPYNGILIVDECSMINSILYDYIVERAKTCKCKILFLGDRKQLYPVKETKLAKPFSAKYSFNLTTVYRQTEDNPVLQTINYLRDRPLYQFSEVRSDKGSMYLYTNWRTFLKDNINLFKEALSNEDPSRVKLLAYTNVRVEAFNKVIRDSIYEDDNEYHIGEFLMGYESSVYKKDASRYAFGFDVINSSEYIIKEITPAAMVIGHTSVTGYVLNLHPLNKEYTDGEVFIISRNNSNEKFAQIAQYIELLRLDAVQCKDKRRAGRIWKDYFRVMESFLTPVDLIYDGRVVRRKSLDYGYCISVHKSQGSNYQDVLIDMGNLFICKNKEELRQLQYVAMSRTRNNVSLLI